MFLFGFTFFTSLENNFYAYSFITDRNDFPGSTMLFNVKVTSWKHQSISAFSRSPKSTAVKHVGCSPSAPLSLSPTHSSPVTFLAQKNLPTYCRHGKSMQMPSTIKLSVERQVIDFSPSQEISYIIVQIKTTSGYIDLHS